MSNVTASGARQRISSLLDANSFVEIGGLITARSTDFNITAKDTPSDGVITGYGLIDGKSVYVYSQDASVLGGSIGEMHAKKIVNLYNIAMKTGAPIIGLIDCAGLRLQEATDALNGFGEMYMAQVKASGVIPQITAVFGNCGGGMALVPELTDFTFMEETHAKLFVNSPNALAGNIDSKCNTAGAAFQSEEAGLVDFLGSETEILSGMRMLISMLPSNFEDEGVFALVTDNLNRVCTDIENYIGDTAILLSQISDNSTFFEIRKDYGKDMVTAFIQLDGATIGAVANRSEVYDSQGNLAKTMDPVISARGAEKAADFVNFCDAFSIPVLTVTNVTGFKATKCSEKRMAKAAGRLTFAFANATTPKVNLITGQAYGSAYLTMNSKSTGADMVFAWPTAEIGMMDAKSAAKIMYEDTDAVTISEKAAEYAILQNSIISAARRGYVDTIIAPEDTRKYVIGAFEMLFSKRENRPAKKHGTV
ncbi:acyl-CoA carboxylase subunit beta [Novisyntrophococcus fermenticellae]|uniref:acyl-CoA carboxylase subunit beta n=1 Tax=Novisyntrophococcus fermenticellae TaxID=2068655 RepID=UPI001E6057E0|nr:carboxyl transferase domain-containing protein [Novisyntrophococcus fermenticellae]